MTPLRATHTARRGITSVALVVIALLLTSCLNPQSAVQSALNESRRAHNLPALRIHQQAQNKAQAWAEQLARENRLYHSTLSDGITARWCGLAENVGYGASVQAVQDAYMRSTAHRNNILSKKWNGVGVGYAKRGDRTFTVQVFIRSC